jgi:hypothetical protein
MKWLMKEGLVEHGMHGLDYGCGKGYDADNLGFDGWDPHHRPDTKNLSMSYDVVTCIYVLNVIEDKEEREETEVRIIGHLNPGGVAYVAARNDRDALNGCTSKGTWQGAVEPITPGWELVESNSRFKLWKFTKSTH